MDALRNLENAVASLLARTQAVSEENMRLKADLSHREQEIAALSEEASCLRSALEKERNQREAACSRLDVLIDQLKKYTCQW